MQLSILIVSRTAGLINRFCESLDAACSLKPLDVEILCSWNGTDEEEGKIANISRYDFHIAQRAPYHFAKNMNGLAALAGGEALMLANDDLILDKGCIDAGLELLKRKPEVGLVGALLRDQLGFLTHAGINFDTRGFSYHLLDQLVPVKKVMNGQIPTGPVPAVTGALQWISRNSFTNHSFNEDYEVNGEDIELCLDVQEHLGKQVWLCSEASAIHEAETTRSLDPLQSSNSGDRLRLRNRCKKYLDSATREQLSVALKQQQRECELLRSLINEGIEEKIISNNELQQHLKEKETVLLSLREERLRLLSQLETLGEFE